jgi:hypothetical protein
MNPTQILAMNKTNESANPQIIAAGSIWNHAVPIGSLVIACASASIGFNASITARQANQLAVKSNKIQLKANVEFEGANKIAMIAAIREASVSARQLLEDPKFTINGMDFSYLRFSTYRFPLKDMQRVNLSHCNLSWAHLEKARLGGAILDFANLWAVELEGAEMWGTSLKESDLRDARCRGTNFRGANFEKAQLNGADFRGADLRGSKWTEAGVGLLPVKNIAFKGDAHGGSGSKVVVEKKIQRIYEGRT